MNWISVEDKFPENNERYIVTDGWAMISASYGFGGWQFDLIPEVFCCEWRKVTHWMPLPKLLSF